MTQTVTNTATATGAASGVATAGLGLTEWVTANSIFIGVGLTIASLIVAVIFHLINIRISNRHHKESMSVRRIPYIADLKSQGKSDEEIKSILSLSGADYAE